MKHVLKASRRLTVTCEGLASTPIWISDTLLSETFGRFSKGWRRHGSHVPGPLEARKRSSRRRNTNIAYSGASLAPIDATGLFGSQSQGQWWRQQPPSKVDSWTALDPSLSHPVKDVRTRRTKEPPAPTLLSWFQEPPPPPVPYDMKEATERTPLSKAELHARKISFKQELRNARDLGDVRLLLQNLELNTPQKHPFYDVACVHVLKSGWGSDVIKEYMLDATLTPSGSRTIRIMTHALQSKWLAGSTRLRLFELLCQGISLGIAPPSEVRFAIESIPNFYMPQMDSLVRLADQMVLHEYYRKILSAVDESQVISLSDLGHDFVSSLVRTIVEKCFVPTSASAVWELGLFLKQPKKDVASAILTKFANFNCYHNVLPAHERQMLSFLEVLPSSALAYALITATQSVMASVDNEASSGHVSIMCWQEFLGSLDEKTVSRAFAAPTWVWQGNEADLSQDERGKRAILVSWITVNMSKNHQYTVKHLGKLGLGNLFRDVYSGASLSGTRDVLAQTLATLQSLRLPDTDVLLGHLRFITDDYLTVRNTEFALKVADQDLGRRFAILANDDDYNQFRLHFNDALVDLAQSVNKDLPFLSYVARTFIEKDDLAFRIITRIIKHNQVFHDALSRAWQQRLSRTRENVPDIQDFTRHLVLDPRQALDFMNHLAISCATSPVTTPRQAVRRVYWCFRMLVRYGAPVERPITRALWHAGVTRYHQADRGTATTLLKWIVKQVRLVEGDGVANLLLTSAGFRKKVRQQLEDLDGLHEKTLPEELDGAHWVDAENTPVEPDAEPGSEVLRAKICHARTLIDAPGYRRKYITANL